jgi:hypothetical protein
MLLAPNDPPRFGRRRYIWLGPELTCLVSCFEVGRDCSTSVLIPESSTQSVTKLRARRSGLNTQTHEATRFTLHSNPARAF